MKSVLLYVWSIFVAGMFFWIGFSAGKIVGENKVLEQGCFEELRITDGENEIEFDWPKTTKEIEN